MRAQLHKAADEQGVQLKGVVYDRPMVSTKKATEHHTGSAKIGSIAEWAVGPMDTESTVLGLKDKTTPILVSHDQRTDSDGNNVLFATQGKDFSDSLRIAGFTDVTPSSTPATSTWTTKKRRRR